MWKKLLVTSLGACLFSSSMLAKPSKKHKPIEDREKQEQLEKEYQGKKAKSKKGVKGWHKNKKKKRLPPGLQKKLDRGGELPPGWQKKLKKGEILDLNVYQKAKPIDPKQYPNLDTDPNDIVTLKIEDQIIRIIKDTRKIIDVLK